MRIKNSTHYRTDDLRRFFLAGLKAEGMDPRRYVIVCVPARGRWVSGRGVLPGGPR